MNIRRLHMGVRLGLGFGMVLAILVAMILLGHFLTSDNKARLMVALEVVNTKSRLAGSMKGSLLESALAMRNIGLLTEVPEMQKEEVKVNRQRELYHAAMQSLSRLGLTAEEKSLVERLDQLVKTEAGPFKEALGQALAFNSEGAAKVLSGKIDSIVQQKLEAINRLVELQSTATAKVLDESIDRDRRLGLMLAACGALGLVLGGSCAWAITRSITMPLRQAVSVAKRVARGELTTVTVLAGNDEISDLMLALQDMSNSLSTIVGEVRSGTETIGVASSQIASGNADLSTRTESQASTLAKTAASMAELTSTVTKNAASAHHANQLVESASAVAFQGGEMVGQVVSTMGSIKKNSANIADIIGVIEGIAFQTNILALNAAVEAARAGEEGRGFSVVAAEVRSLAQRCASAAKQIKTLIGDSEVVIKNGSGLVDETGRTMVRVVDSVKSVAVIIGEISAASQAQSLGIEEINNAISMLDTMTQRNAALVEQAAAAAESMREQARNLEQTVRVFKIDGAIAA